MSDSPEIPLETNLDRTWIVRGTHRFEDRRSPFIIPVHAKVLSQARDIVLQMLANEDPQIDTIELVGGDLVTPGEYDDFVGPPIERDLTVETVTDENVRIAAGLPDVRAEYAEKILLHYFKTVWDAAGLPWNSDNEVEIVGAIEDIVKAARA